MSTHQPVSNNDQLNAYLWLMLANLFTFLNLVSGLFGIYYSLQGNVFVAFQLLLIGAFFDLFDGKIAKKSHLKFSFGDYADSFADLITFVLLPGFMVLSLDSLLWLGDIQLISQFTLGQVFASIYAIGGWYRLIRFSSKPTGVKFEGFPSPASAMLVGSLTILVVEFQTIPINIILTITVIASGLLMSSTIDYPSPKRMMQSDNLLITIAGIIGAVYVILPNVISAFFVYGISLFYTLVGPYYFDLTQKESRQNHTSKNN